MINQERINQKRMIELHAHYARNALAVGHASTCPAVTDKVNWPTLMGRPACDCSYVPPWERGN